MNSEFPTPFPTPKSEFPTPFPTPNSELRTPNSMGCRLFVAMAPTPPKMGLPEFQENLSKLMAINPEVIFWEPINARGTNGTRMLEAGIEFAKDISNTKTWAENFIRQWQEIETAASLTGCQELLHIWPDKALKEYISSDQLEHWWSKPTVEQWQFDDPHCKPPHPESPQEAPTNNIADSQYSFSKLDISFGHTCDRLLSGSKTVTRREWKPRHVNKFIKAYENNQLVRALSKDRRYKGEQVGWLKLTSVPYQEPLSEINQADCAAEGYPELTPLEFHKRFFRSLAKETEVWVIKFQFIPKDSLPELTVPSSQATGNQEALLPATLATPETRTFDDYPDPSDRMPDRMPDRTTKHLVEKKPITTCSEPNQTAEQLTLLPELSPELSQVSPWTKDCWRTPNNFEQPILDLVAKALGGTIGLDPTADDRHNVPAQRYFSKADNCLIQDDWSSPAGTVFMNPPFSNPLPFLEKLVNAIGQGQVKEAIVLLPVNCINNIGTGELIQRHARAYCHWRSRIAFLDELGNPQKKSNFDCALIYFGDRPIRFTNCFYNYGTPSLLALEPAKAIDPGWLTTNNIKDVKEQFDILDNKTVKAAFADKWLGICAENLATTLELCNELLSTMQSEELYKVSSSIEGNVAYKNFDDYYSQRFNQELQQLFRLGQKQSTTSGAPFGITTVKSDRQLLEPNTNEFGVPSSEFGVKIDHRLPEPNTNEFGVPSSEFGVKPCPRDLQLPEPTNEFGVPSSEFRVKSCPSDRQLSETDTGDRRLSEPTNEFGVRSSEFGVTEFFVKPDTSNRRLSEPTNEFRVRGEEFGVKPDTSNRRLSELEPSDRQLPKLNCVNQQLLSPDKSDRKLPTPANKNKFSVKTPNSELRTPNSKRRAPKNEGSGYIEKILCNVQRNLARGKDPDYYWQYHYFYTDENGVAKHRSTHVSKSLYSKVCDLISSNRSHEEILETLNKKKRRASSSHQKNLNRKNVRAS